MNPCVACAIRLIQFHDKSTTLRIMLIAFYATWPSLVAPSERIQACLSQGPRLKIVAKEQANDDLGTLKNRQ